MSELARAAGGAVVVFASTNIDDLVVLSVLFADGAFRPRFVVAGQYLGIASLLLVSAIVGLLAVAVPAGWIALLGVVPLGVGIYKGAQALRGDEAPGTVPPARGSQALLVAGLTLANGGDNLGVYIPLLSARPALVPVYAVVFAVMTGAWCALGYRLVKSPHVGTRLRRYGHIVGPVVLVGIGLEILSGARALW